ncbi:hypothetical protein PUN4_350028 [Paraburkholderia unamae]|nr:hypothetical protein PUN4_350028 [Paraburkholderia unamae]
MLVRNRCCRQVAIASKGTIVSCNIASAPCAQHKACTDSTSNHFRLTAQAGAPHTRPMHTSYTLLIVANAMNHPWKTHTGDPRGWCAY